MNHFIRNKYTHVMKYILKHFVTNDIFGESFGIIHLQHQRLLGGIVTDVGEAA